MAVIMQNAARGIGFNLQVRRVPADGFWSNFWLKAPFTYGNINPRPNPDILFSLFFQSSGAVERKPLEEREVRPAAAGRAGRDGFRQAEGDLRPDAAAGARSRRASAFRCSSAASTHTPPR